MKRITLLTLFYAYTQFIFSQNNENLLVIVLMVKNEEHVINKTLEPFVKEGINSFLIFDTGSTDKTIETVQEYCKQNSLTNCLIFQEPFIDFATSRNHALRLAEEYFPDAVFLLMPDAEWYLHNVKGLIDFCQEHRDEDYTCYLMRIANKDLDFTVPRLIRARSNAEFVGKVHEIIPTSHIKKVPPSVFFELGVSKSGFEKTKKRWERDLQILLESYEENPQNSRTLFYLAQTYECLGDFSNAYKFYKLRSELNGWIEENYETFYRLARITEILSQSNSEYTWDMAQNYYFIAHNILPLRAEPLVHLAEHYWPYGKAPENIALCYLFAKRAYELSYPENHNLFIYPDFYHFKRYELLSKSACYMGDYNLGELATRKALEYKELPHLLRNLAYYIEANQTTKNLSEQKK